MTSHSNISNLGRGIALSVALLGLAACGEQAREEDPGVSEGLSAGATGSGAETGETTTGVSGATQAGDETGGPSLEDCTPGARRCAPDAPDTPQTCADDGSEWLDGDACSDPSAPCREGECRNLCDEAAESNSYMGCEYWAASLGNVRQMVFGLSPFEIVLANPHDEPVTASVEGGPLLTSQSIEIAPQTVEVLTMDSIEDLTRSYESVLVQDAAVRIRTSLPITAYQFSYGPTGGDEFTVNDASLLLPVTVLSENYLVLSYPDAQVGETTTYYGGGVSLIGVSETPTTVTVELTNAIRPGPGVSDAAAGSTQTYTLEQGAVLELHGSGLGDMTGTRIRASAPVSAFSSHVGARVPAYNGAPVDHIEDQLMPMETWGQQFVVSPLEGIPSQVRIMAMGPTNVSFQPPSVHGPASLGSGEFVELRVDENMAIEADGPVLVGQYMHSPNEVESYPSLVLAVPTEQFRSATVFQTPQSHPSSWINIVAQAGSTPELDDEPVSGTPSAIAGSDFAVWTVPVGPGSHRVAAGSGEVGVTVYGVEGVTTYAYPAGLDLSEIVTVIP